MSTLLIRVAVGDGVGRLPAQRIHQFVRVAQRRWPALAMNAREFPDGPNGPWVGVLVSIDNRSVEAERHGELLETRLAAYLEGNKTLHYRSTYFPGDLSFEEALQYE